ncbi:MAG: alpha/beta hydrolase, partial [Mycobacterium sp.]
MTEQAGARPGIDPTFKSLLDAVPLTFRVADGVEHARSQMKLLQVPEDALPNMRIEDRTIG